MAARTTLFGLIGTADEWAILSALIPNPSGSPAVPAAA
jgi:hypothetical protein